MDVHKWVQSDTPPDKHDYMEYNEAFEDMRERPPIRTKVARLLQRVVMWLEK